VPEQAKALRRAAQDRHDARAARAEVALEALRHQGRPVSFGQLAKAAGVARSWLYRQLELREKVMSCEGGATARGQPGQDQQRPGADSLRQQLHVYREELARVRAENTALKEQLARQLGQPGQPRSPRSPERLTVGYMFSTSI